MVIPRSDFIGLEKLTHLSAGGESPALKSHRVAVEQFFADKALGEVSRERMDETVRRCKQKEIEASDDTRVHRIRFQNNIGDHQRCCESV
jgi:hypothetical protein